MIEYENRQDLILQILNNAKLFIKEFDDINEKDKDKLIDGIDRTPAQKKMCLINSFKLAYLEMASYKYCCTL